MQELDAIGAVIGLLRCAKLLLEFIFFTLIESRQ